jgi:hypothetical protein
MAKYEKPNRHLSFTANYYGINNYMYFDGFFAAKQATGLFNLLQLSLEKKWHLKGHWNWYTEMHVQQKIGTGPVNVPVFYTRNRLAFEGNFFTNLDVSAGLELQYFTAYKADGYSPFLGAFFYQNSNEQWSQVIFNFLHDVLYYLLNHLLLFYIFNISCCGFFRL